MSKSSGISFMLFILILLSFLFSCESNDGTRYEFYNLKLKKYNSIIFYKPKLALYSKNIVFDKKNKLLWQRFPLNKEISHENINLFLSKLKIDGISGWQLPRDYEFEAIFFNSNFNLDLFNKFFPNFNKDTYWYYHGRAIGIFNLHSGQKGPGYVVPDGFITPYCIVAVKRL